MLTAESRRLLYDFFFWKKVRCGLFFRMHHFLPKLCEQPRVSTMRCAGSARLAQRVSRDLRATQSALADCIVEAKTYRRAFAV